jgi:hypothetical protein
MKIGSWLLINVSRAARNSRSASSYTQASLRRSTQLTIIRDTSCAPCVRRGRVQLPVVVGTKGNRTDRAKVAGGGSRFRNERRWLKFSSKETRWGVVSEHAPAGVGIRFCTAGPAGEQWAGSRVCQRPATPRPCLASGELTASKPGRVRGAMILCLHLSGGRILLDLQSLRPPLRIPARRLPILFSPTLSH